MLTLAAPLSHAQSDVAIAKRATDLRDTPGDAGRKIRPLAASTPLLRLGPRQGPWVQVRTERGDTGWLHMFDVGAAGGASQGGVGTDLRNLSTPFQRNRPSATVTATSTVGIRGLGEEDLARAQPNPKAVMQMEALRTDAGAARQFARHAALAPRSVGELPAPSFFSLPGGGE